MMNVLLVEDNRAEARLIEEMLVTAAGTTLQFDWADRLSTGLEHLAAGNTDVVLLDLSLPDSRGFQTFTKVYAQTPDVPVIVLSGLDDEEMAMKAVREGAQDYLVKGEVDGDLLMRAMRYAIERKHAEEQLARRNRELATLNTIAATVNRSLDLNQILTDALDEILRLKVLGKETQSAIFLWDPHEEELSLAVYRGNQDNLPCLEDPSAAGCLCKQAAQEGQVLIAQHTAEDDREQPPPPNILSHQEICIPLQARGRILGTLAIWLPPTQAFKDEDIQLLKAMSDQISMAIENARLYEEAQLRARELAALNTTSQAIASTLDRDAILELVMSQAQAMLNAEAASVLLHDTTTDELVFAATVGPHSEQIVGTRMPVSEGVAGWVFRKGHPTVVDGASEDDRFYNQVDRQTGLSTESILAVPMVYKERVIGVIETLNKADGPFNMHDLDLLNALAASAASAIENARLIEAEREQRRLVQQSQNQLVQSEKLAATGRLAASMAHEINNPLQAIHNSLQLMLAFPLEPEEQSEYLQMADEEVERLIGMVGRILDFARRPQREMRPVDINGVIKKVLTLSDKFLQHRQIALERDMAPDLPPVLAVPGELGQVFLNLLLNAVDAMPDGGTLYISTTLTEDQRITISFRDTGQGIAPDNINRVFEPFFSTKESGTGLGLAVSYNVIERHNGDITVKSTVGEGTTFTIWLPAASE